LGTQRDGAQVNDYFHAILRYPQLHDLRVVLHGSTLVAGIGPRFVVHGTQGSFVKFGLDTQEDTLKTGVRPTTGDADWGQDPVMAQLTLQRTDGLMESDMSMPNGHYPSYYAAVAQAVQGRVAAPVTPSQVEQAMEILSLGEESFRRSAFVQVQHRGG
jgi:predicted dehydrogenase